MLIGCIGKGGVGKSTLTNVLTERLACLGKPVIIFDNDLNQELKLRFGYSDKDLEGIPAIGDLEYGLPLLKQLLHGRNPLFSPEDMIKSTLPGPFSHLIDPSDPDDPVLKIFGAKKGVITLIRTGEFATISQGRGCYHKQLAASELLLNHIIDSPEHYIIADMTAGVDAFSSGAFLRPDILLLCVEPTQYSLNVYRQYCAGAEAHDQKMNAAGIPPSARNKIVVVGNKIKHPWQETMIREVCGKDLITLTDQHGLPLKDKDGRELKKGFLKMSELLEARAAGEYYERYVPEDQRIDTSDFENNFENILVLDSIFRAAENVARRRDLLTRWEEARSHHHNQTYAPQSRQVQYDMEFLGRLSPETLQDIKAGYERPGPVSPEHQFQGYAPS